MREYIYLPETEIAPAADGRTRVDRPLAVVNAVNTATPATYYVHVDHLNRPVMMTDGAKVQVWAATWQAWGGSYSITGPQANDMRFPGQWFQLESGLHYYWHRHYDPSIGRYTQPDPLGFVYGPSVLGYVKGMPQSAVDPSGQAAAAVCAIPGMCTIAIPAVGRAIVRQCVRVISQLWNDDEDGPECVPTAGTKCFDGPDFGRPHGGLSPHYQIYVMQKKKNEGNKCEWRPIRKSGGVVGSQPTGMNSCQSYPNWQRKGGGRGEQ